jgi:hypothetical protein
MVFVGLRNLQNVSKKYFLYFYQTLLKVSSEAFSYLIELGPVL